MSGGGYLSAVLLSTTACGWIRPLTRQHSLADEFAELRQIMQEEHYEFTLPPRSTRPNALVTVLEEELRELPR